MWAQFHRSCGWYSSAWKPVSVPSLRTVLVHVLIGCNQLCPPQKMICNYILYIMWILNLLHYTRTEEPETNYFKINSVIYDPSCPKPPPCISVFLKVWWTGIKVLGAGCSLALQPRIWNTRSRSSIWLFLPHLLSNVYFRPLAPITEF